MWVKRAEYVALVEKAAKGETRADWLMQRVNQLEREAGTLRHNLTGQPQVVPTFAKEPPVAPKDADAETEFEDMGDARARVHGVEWDDQGRVVFGQ